MTIPTRAAIKKYFASGPCLICGDATYNAVHRLVDALRDRFRAGETVATIASDYRMPRAVVAYAVTTPIRELDWLRRYREEGCRGEDA